jgi:hypothetical protein
VSSTLRPLEVAVEGRKSCCGREVTSLFVLPLPPACLNRELLLLDWDFGERIGFEE